MCGVFSGVTNTTFNVTALFRCRDNDSAPPRFRCVASNEFGSVPSHPATLSIDCGPALSIRLVQSNQIELCWLSHSNSTYQVEYSPELTTNSWTALGGPLLATNATTCIFDELIGGLSQRFYRVFMSP